MKCRACFSQDLREFVDLGFQPPSNDFTHKGRLQYPLKMMVCEDCGLGQLSEDVPPVDIFTDYMYFSSMSPTWVEDRKVLAHRMINEFNLDSKSLVIDIGSNDGYYLRHFVEEGVGVMGYEPAANVAQVAIKAGVQTRTEFWSASTHALHADLVNATNVLAHTPDMDGFVAGVAAALTPDGVATFEFPLFSNLIENTQLDTIYHEHYSYISVHSLSLVLNRHGLRIWRIEEVATHGGSVRVFACRAAARFVEEGLLLVGEHWAPGWPFKEQAERVKWNLLEFLASVRYEGQIVGYGAPAKATVMCNYVGLDADIIDFTVDDSPAKQGKHIPGTSIPIVPFSALEESNPKYILVFAWNLFDPIQKKLAHFYADPKWTDVEPKLITAIPELVVTKI